MSEKHPETDVEMAAAGRNSKSGTPKKDESSKGKGRAHTGEMEENDRPK